MAYPAATVLLGFVLLQRKHDGDFLEFVLWTWILSPELRRVVDWQTGWHPLSPVMVAAPVLTLLALGPALVRVGRMRLESRVLFTVVLVAMAYGVCVGIVRNGVSASAADLLQWVAPVALGLWIANAGPSAAVLRRVLLRTALWATVVIAVYGLVQFFVLPAWDAAWMLAAPLASIGRPEPFEVRIFSILNSPGPMALVLIAFMLVLVGSSGRRTWLGHSLGLVALALSLVRAAWIGLLVGVWALCFRLPRKVLAWILLDVALLTVVILAVPQVQDLVLGRFTTSVDSGSHDESFTARLAFHELMLPVVLRDPVGSGLGASGVATKVANGGALGTSGDFDGGALQVLFTFGAVIGPVLLIVLMWVVARTWRRTRGGAPFEAACAAALIALIVQLAFGNPFTSVTGVVLWTLLGTLGRQDVDQRPPGAGAEAVIGTISRRRPRTAS